MHFITPPYEHKFNCLNPVLIIDLLTINYQFMVCGSYIPNNSNVQENFYLFIS
jgi:hypothetical protein